MSIITVVDLGNGETRTVVKDVFNNTRSDRRRLRNLPRTECKRKRERKQPQLGAVEDKEPTNAATARGEEGGGVYLRMGHLGRVCWVVRSIILPSRHLTPAITVDHVDKFRSHGRVRASLLPLICGVRGTKFESICWE